MVNGKAAAMDLETRRLGASDLNITRIGFGAWAIGGGDWEFSWGHQEDKDSVQAIHRALDLGMNWIDTAAVYGLGHSEEVVGRALREVSHKPYVFTKCSMRWEGDRTIYRSLQSRSVREELENSLRRLGVERIDLYQIHWPNPENEIEEGWETLARLQEEGKVRWIGVSNFSVAQMERVGRIAPITSLQPPYSLVNRGVESGILKYCEEHNIGVIVYSPMASGLLTGKMSAERIAALPGDDWRRRSPQFQEPKLSRNLRLVEVLREIGEAHGVQPGVVAIAWTLRQPAVTGAIVGARNAGQVEGIFPAASFRLSGEEAARIDAFVRENLGS
jgi:aryl-alcohol dehydrogenase-like predicted oxidoreductase